MIVPTFSESIGYLWSFPILHLGNAVITLGQITSFFLVFALLYVFSFKAFHNFIKSILTKFKASDATASRAAYAASYLIFFMGIIVSLQTFGIDMTTFSIIGGAIGIGIGLGLQNIASNFISGIILFFEKPIKIGDQVELDNTQGIVEHIAFRAITINTFDNVTIIIPNSHFIQNKIINWSHHTHRIRLHLPVSVGYNSSPEHVKTTLLDVASQTEGILPIPEAEVRFLGFGESALDFELLIWTNNKTNSAAQLKSTLYFNIFNRFQQEKIELPFPQRDLHIKYDSRLQESSNTKQDS